MNNCKFCDKDNFCIPLGGPCWSNDITACWAVTRAYNIARAEQKEAIQHFRHTILSMPSYEVTSEYNQGFIDGLEFCINDLQSRSKLKPSQYAYLKPSATIDSVYECSVCGCTYGKSAPGVIRNYCSKCGAKFIERE